MLNLLLISDSPKAEYIKSVLHPDLKVIIDVVTDFDQGLKDVFEKRPSTVCIQDHIGNVTGESVARHIQMLLGVSAPTFVLLNTGNKKANVIKGLYEHCIDLSMSDDAVVEDVKKTLKSLLGDQWGTVYIQSKSTPVSVKLPTAVTEKPREESDKLENSLLSEPDSSEDICRTVESDRAKAIDDDLAELHQMEVDKICRDENAIAANLAASAKSEETIIAKPKQKTAELKPAPSSIKESPASPETFTGIKLLEKVEVATAAAAPVVTPSTPPAAEFRISQNTNQVEEHIPEELLLAFEENYRSDPLLLRRTVVVVLVCAVFAAGGWFFVKQKPQLVSSLTQRLLYLSGAKQSPVTAPVAVPSAQKPDDSKVTLPGFIPKTGHDSTYAVKNPGWERYVNDQNEYRVFSASGRIMAVQVLAIKETTISETFIKTVLQELVGSPDYQRTSRNTKANVHIENGKIQNKGEIKIYWKNGDIMAFVVSVN